MIRPLLGRALSTVGLLTIPLLVLADTGGAEEVDCESVASEECPDAAAALTLYREGDWWASCPVTAVLSDPSRDGGDCCYTVQLDCEEPDTGGQIQYAGCR